MPSYQNTQQTAKAMLKTIPILHMGLLAGQVLFAIVSFNISPPNTFYWINHNDPFVFVVPIIAIACYALGNFLFRQQIGAAIEKPTVQQKVAGYQTAMIIRFAMLEGASLFGIVSYLLTGNLLLIGISGLLIVYFIILRPTRDKIETELNLDYQEKMELDSDDAPDKH